MHPINNKENKSSHTTFQESGRLNARNVRQKNVKRLSLNVHDYMSHPDHPQSGPLSIDLGIYAHDEIDISSILDEIIEEPEEEKRMDASLSLSSPRNTTFKKDNQDRIDRSFSDDYETIKSGGKKRGKGIVKKLLGSKEKNTTITPSSTFFSQLSAFIARAGFRDLMISLKSTETHYDFDKVADVQAAWLNLVFALDSRNRGKIINNLLFSALSKAKEPELILREDSSIRFLLAQFIQKKMAGLEKKIQAELDKMKHRELNSKDRKKVEYDQINQLLGKTLDMIFDYCNELPPKVHLLLYFAKKKCLNLFPENSMTSVVSLFFLQGLSPRLTAMKTANTKNQLILTILLQKLANNVRFDVENMSHYNPVLEKHQKRFEAIIDLLHYQSTSFPSHAVLPISIRETRSSLRTIIHFFSENLDLFETRDPSSLKLKLNFIQLQEAYRRAGFSKKISSKNIKTWIKENQQCDPDKELGKAYLLFEKRMCFWGAEEVELWVRIALNPSSTSDYILFHEMDGKKLYRIASGKEGCEDTSTALFIQGKVLKLCDELKEEKKGTLLRLKEKGIQFWNLWDVLIWLNILHLTDYIGAAAMHRIDGIDLYTTNISDICEVLGIKKIGDQLKLKKGLHRIFN